MSELTNLFLGGFLGTIVMTMMILFGDKMKMMEPGWNMLTDGLGKKMNDMMGVPTWMGYVVHFIIGIVAHPLLFLYVWTPLVSLTGFVSVLVFIMIFGVMMVMMLGMLGVPSEWKMKTAVGVLMAHLMYAIVLSLF